MLMVIVLAVFDQFTNFGISPSWYGYRIQSPRSTTEVRLHCSLGCSLMNSYIPLRFPPKNAKPNINGSGLPSLSSPVTTFPTSILAQSEIWEEGTRKSLQKPRYKKEDLDLRRSKVGSKLTTSAIYSYNYFHQNLVPGTPLHPQRQDNRIPVLLIQRSLESSIPSRTPQSIHGWTLIIPSGWSMAFFSSLTHTGTRVGGQRERQTQSFETGSTYFPRDYPSTDAYASYADEREEKEKGKWERKPPAKRANFTKLGTRSPWRPDWEVVLGLETAGIQINSNLVSTQREEASSMAKKVRPWLLRGADVPGILENASNMFNPGAGLLAEINKLRMKRSQDPLENSIRSDDLWKAALVMVQITMCGRGSPDDLAVIYDMDDNETRKWDNILDRRGPTATLSNQASSDEVEVGHGVV